MSSPVPGVPGSGSSSGVCALRGLSPSWPCPLETDCRTSEASAGFRPAPCPPTPIETAAVLRLDGGAGDGLRAPPGPEPIRGNARTHDRHRPHHRFRQPGHAAYRATRARGRSSTPKSCRSTGRTTRGAHGAQGGDPVGRARERDGDPHAPCARLGLHVRPSSSRNLLRRADDGRPARRRGRRRPSPRVRPRRNRGGRGLGAVSWFLAERRARRGLDEPRRSRDAAAGRLPRRGRFQGRAVRGDRRRGAASLCRAVPPGGRPRRAGASALQLRAQDCGPGRRLDHGPLPLERDCAHPDAGRRRPRHLGLSGASIPRWPRC